MIRPLKFLLPMAGCLAMSGGMADTREEAPACAEIENDALRLECYDQSARGDGEDETPETNANTTSMEAAETAGEMHEKGTALSSDAPSTAEDRFGLDVSRERGSGEDEPGQITASITEIESRPHGHRIFTLDNGQVWAEESASPGLRLQVGDTVTVKSGLFGSYRIFGSGNKSSRVERIQ